MVVSNYLQCLSNALCCSRSPGAIWTRYCTSCVATVHAVTKWPPARPPARPSAVVSAPDKRSAASDSARCMAQDHFYVIARIVMSVCSTYQALFLGLEFLLGLREVLLESFLVGSLRLCNGCRGSFRCGVGHFERCPESAAEGEKRWS